MANALAALDLVNLARIRNVRGTSRRCFVLVPVLRTVDVDAAGEPLAILGRSGSCRSTPRP
jgi:predicted ABC-type transport system involved in lysophospholipase L1 biosynthesis ATPase subunit